MTHQWQINRAGLFWLLIVMTAIVVGLASVLPAWVFFFCVLCVLWRTQIFRGAWNTPTKLIKVFLVVASLGGLLLQYRSLASLEALSAMLICGFVLKLLEINRRRDAILFSFVSFFCSALLVIFEQNIVTGLYSLLCVLFATAALIGLNQSDRVSLWVPLGKGSLVLIQSIPLMLVLFLVMPRLGAFWSIPTQKHQGTTGVSGEMAPGDLVQLGKNGALAFRATFKGGIPTAQELYWRGPVLSTFDGRTWRQADPQFYEDGSHLIYGKTKTRWLDQVKRGGKRYEYNIILEPTYQPWLFSLTVPNSQSPSVGLTRELRLVNNRPVNSKISYDVISWTNYRYFQDSLTALDKNRNLQLPSGFNPKGKQLALDWRHQSASDSEYIDRVLQWFNQEFIYTLKPPKLGKHSIDDFLFKTKKGFCSYYASSFTFLMRAAGIPSRVVTGYQGAEQHSSGNYLLVHQYNAHGWSEVWLQGRGWVRIDPTVSVAPERIEMGFEALFGDDEEFLRESPLSLTRFRNVAWLNSLRMNLDMLNYYWGRWVLNYDDRQQAFLNNLLGAVTGLRIALLLFATAIVVLGLIAIFLLRGNKEGSKLTDAEKQFALYCDKLSSVGMTRQNGEGSADFALRTSEKFPEHAPQIQQISRQFQLACYAQEIDALLGLKAMIKKFKVARRSDR